MIFLSAIITKHLKVFPAIHFPSATPPLRTVLEVLPVAGKVLANFLLIVPQQPVQSKHVAIADEGQAVVDSVASRTIGCNIKEEPRVQNQR